jgi:hypothetical protein
VNVIGSRCIGNGDSSLFAAAKFLAQTLKIELLCARFTSPEPDSPLLCVDYWVDITNLDVSQAILEYFKERAGQ